MVNIALRAARRAGEIIVRAAERMDRVRIDEKAATISSPNDQAAERNVHHLKRAYPTHFLGEEFGLVEGSDPDYRWIIDPLDGTTTLIQGAPLRRVDRVPTGAAWRWRGLRSHQAGRIHRQPRSRCSSTAVVCVWAPEL